VCVEYGVWGSPKGKTTRKVGCGAAQREINRQMERACVVWNVRQPKGKTIGKWNVCVQYGMWGSQKGKTIRKMKCGAAQREINRQMKHVCVVWSVGQSKGKTIRKWSVCVCSKECGAAQTENSRKMECVCGECGAVKRQKQ